MIQRKYWPSISRACEDGLIARPSVRVYFNFNPTRLGDEHQ